jgi:hypothetical protein
VTVLKKFLERLRKNFNHSILNQNPKKVEKQQTPFLHFGKFMKDLLAIFQQKSGPETPFESLNVVFEVLTFIYRLFGFNDFTYKNVFYPGSDILNRLGFFDVSVFNSLCVCLNNSSDSHRNSVFSILASFPKDSPFLAPFQVDSHSSIEHLLNNPHTLTRLIFTNRTKTNVKDIDVYSYAVSTLFQLQKSRENQIKLLQWLLTNIHSNFQKLNQDKSSNELLLISSPIHLDLSTVVMIFQKNHFLHDWQHDHLHSVFSQYMLIVLKLVNFINHLIDSAEGTHPGKGISKLRVFQ